MISGSSGTSTSNDRTPPRLTRRRYWPKVMPIELPTRNVAGSPTSVSSPAALLTMAVSTRGLTKSTSRALDTRTRTGARRTTVVAFGSSAHTGATSAMSSSRKSLPLPRVARR